MIIEPFEWPLRRKYRNDRLPKRMSLLGHLIRYFLTLRTGSLMLRNFDCRDEIPNKALWRQELPHEYSYINLEDDYSDGYGVRLKQARMPRKRPTPEEMGAGPLTDCPRLLDAGSMHDVN